MTIGKVKGQQTIVSFESKPTIDEASNSKGRVKKGKTRLPITDDLFKDPNSKSNIKNPLSNESLSSGTKTIEILNTETEHEPELQIEAKEPESQNITLSEKKQEEAGVVQRLPQVKIL